MAIIANNNPMKTGDAPVATVTLKAMQYTIEPGFPECGQVLDERSGGGLGSAPPAAKYFDFFDNDRSPLLDFLETLTCVEGEYASYCTKSIDDVVDYIREYLNIYLSATSYGKRVIDEILEHFQGFPMRNEYFKHEAYRENMVMGTQFFNDFFYDSAFMVAAELLPDELRGNCFYAFGLPPEGMAIMSGEIDGFIERFRANPKYRIFADLPELEFAAEFGTNGYDDMAYGPAFYCSMRDYENYLKPFILFLSNWSLLLGTYLSMRVFGQCAFVVCWEGPLGNPLPSFRPTRE